MQNQAFNFELKNIGEDGLIEGYASTFGNVDSGGDIVQRGAFAASLADKKARDIKIPMLWAHNMAEQIGVWDDIKEDDRGLAVKGRFVLEVQRAREVQALAKAGSIGGLSIGYSVPKGGAVYDAKTNTRALKSVDLGEVSLVSIPMNTEARITRVKSHDHLIRKALEGEPLTVREQEELFKHALDLSNTQAERFVRCLKGQGEPAKTPQNVSAEALLRALGAN